MACVYLMIDINKKAPIHKMPPQTGYEITIRDGKGQVEQDALIKVNLLNNETE
jgi:hypothetical protein